MSAELEFVYRLKPTRTEMLSQGPTADEEATLARHFGYLKGLHERGVVLHAGRTLVTDERCFGIVILTADSEEKARELMDDDPALVDGVMRAELFPYRTALPAGG